MKKHVSELTPEEFQKTFPITLEDVVPEYAVWYEEEKAAVFNALGEKNIVRINHIGSSAVRSENRQVPRQHRTPESADADCRGCNGSHQCRHAGTIRLAMRTGTADYFSLAARNVPACRAVA